MTGHIGLKCTVSSSPSVTFTEVIRWTVLFQNYVNFLKWWSDYIWVVLSNVLKMFYCFFSMVVFLHLHWLYNIERKDDSGVWIGRMWPILMDSSYISLERLRKTTKNIRIADPVSFEYETGFLTSTPRHSLIFLRCSFWNMISRLCSVKVKGAKLFLCLSTILWRDTRGWRWVVTLTLRLLYYGEGTAGTPGVGGHEPQRRTGRGGEEKILAGNRAPVAHSVAIHFIDWNVPTHRVCFVGFSESASCFTVSIEFLYLAEAILSCVFTLVLLQLGVTRLQIGNGMYS